VLRLREPSVQRSGERGNQFLRIADRVAGIPAILAIGAMRRLMRPATRSIPRNPRVIGLLKASGIGDAVILSGVIADLRAHFPNAFIVLFCGESNHAFARLLDGLDQVVPLPVRRPQDAVRCVRAYRPDIMIDFGMWPRLEAMLATLSGATWVAGVRTPGQHRHFAYDFVVEHTTEHEIVNYRNLVAPLGIRSTSMPGLRAGSAEARPLQRPYAVFHLWPGGSNAAERSWPTDCWFALAQALDRRGYGVVLTGGPGDVERTRAVVGAWKARAVDAQSVAGLKAEETIVWLRHARGAVSVNTGPMHVAAAVGTPTVALNGPTSSRRWGPLGTHTRCVSSPAVPEGYLNLGWERRDRFRTCMQAITVDAVLAAWDGLLVEVDAEAMRRDAAELDTRVPAS
jgi:ADP-heptose:LPS heptosyltransferase